MTWRDLSWSEWVDQLASAARAGVARDSRTARECKIE